MTRFDRRSFGKLAAMYAAGSSFSSEQAVALTPQASDRQNADRPFPAGYEKRFGITYVDFATQKRTPKLSSKFYANVIRRGSL
jgi:hypothetical protein